MLMKKNEISQKELAQLVGVSDSALSRYIKEERTPSYDVILNLATALNTTVRYLMNGEETENEYEELYTILARSSKRFTEEQKLKLIRLITGDK